MTPFFRTLRYLRPSQIIWRLWYRARLPFFKYGIGLPQQIYGKILNRPTQNWPASSDILGEEYTIEVPLDWHPVDRSHLWRFTLNYFEWIRGINDTKKVRELVDDWIKQHPKPDNEAWHPYPTSLRLWIWLEQSDRILEGADHGFKRDFISSIYRQALHLERTIERDVGGNHIIKNIKTLIMLCKCLDGWRDKQKYFQDILLEQLKTQILDDGMHYELSPSYHLQVLCDLIDISQFIKEDWLGTCIGKMLSAYSFMCHPDKTLALFNDGDEGNAETIDIINNKYIINEIDALHSAGYYKLHNNKFNLIIDIGRCCPDSLPAHAHADTLSFELSVYGQRVFVNSGTYAYQNKEWRNYFRSTASKNTVEISQHSSAEVYGVFRLGRRPEEVRQWHEDNWLCGSHDGYKFIGARHTRKLMLGDHALYGQDVIESDKNLLIQIHFHLHPDIKAEITNNIVYLTIPSGKKLEFKCSNGKTEISKGFYAPKFYIKQESKHLIITSYSRNTPIFWEIKQLI